MSIPGLIVRLRAPEETDLPALHAWANDEALWTQLGGWRFPSNFDSARAWLGSQGKDPANHRFVIEVVESGEIIGTANLTEIDWKNRHAHHGMLLGPVDLRGKGYGRDVVMAVMRYAFDELGLERLDGDIIEFNEASYRLYVGKCGWKEEGRQRRWHYRLGRYWDRILVGVTRDDYRALVEETGYWAQKKT